MTIDNSRISEILNDATKCWPQNNAAEYTGLEKLIINTHKQRNGQYKSAPLTSYFAAQKQQLTPEAFACFRAFALLKTLQRCLSAPATDLPAALHAELEKNRARLLSWADQPAQWDQYVDDVYWKDLAIAGGALIPLRGGVLHLAAGLGFRQALSKQLVSSLSYLTLLFRYGRSPYFEIHTHLPLVADFNQQNWQLNYQDISSLLLQHPDVKGVFRASWFLDPKLQTISPNLSYLRSFPLANGAKLFAVGPDDSNAAFARSETRKAMFSKGEYLPYTYLMVWPRKPLLKYFAQVDNA